MVFVRVWYFGLKGHSGEIAGKFYVRPLFLVFGFFCVVETLLFLVWGGSFASLDW